MLAAPTAYADEIEANSTVSAALVYSRGATIERVARFVAPAGRHEIVIADLPVALDKESIRVAGAASASGDDPAGSFEILGVAHKIKKPRVAPLSEPERQSLLDEIEELEWELRGAEDAIAEAKARLDYMSAFRNASVGGRPPRPWARRKGKKAQGPARAGEPGLRPRSANGDPSLFEYSAQWPEAWSLIASESAAARQALRTAEREKKRIAKTIDTKRDQLERVGPPPPARGVVTVSIRAAEPISTGTLTISYLTTRARWTPLYDLKLSSEGVEEPGLQGKLALIRRASVTQNTGEDWENVRLRLSSARPRGRVSAPTPGSVQAVLAPIVEAKTRNRNALTRENLQDQQDGFRAAERAEAEPPAPLAAQRPVDLLELNRSVLASEAQSDADFSSAGVVYTIPDPAVIPGDGEARQVRIGVEEAKVVLVARAAPAREPTAYLYALHKVAKEPLLPGRASIYRDGVFYGQTRLAAVAPGDETALPFGPLDEVKITYRIINRSNKVEGLIATSNKREARFELGARNLGTTPRRITLFAARPFTETDDIKVTRTGLAPTEQEIEGRRGVLSWTFNLAAGAEKTTPFGYDITWPEGRRMILRR